MTATAKPKPGKSLSASIREAMQHRGTTPEREPGVATARTATPRRRIPVRRPKPMRLVDGVATAGALFAERKPKVSVLELGSIRTSEAAFSLAGPSAPTVTAATIADPVGDPLLVESAGRPAVHGPAAIIATLERVGVRLELLPDRSGIVARTEMGVLPVELRSAIDEVSPLVHGYLAGSPLTCSWCDAEAVTSCFPHGFACSTHIAEEM